MAGLFGMFDSSKPGPGVSKNEPKKKRFFQFWELFGRKFTKLILANLLYVLVSLPIVTHGLAQAGLTFATRNFSREKHVFLPSDFFDTIRKNWKQALATGLLELGIGALLLFDLWYAWQISADGQFTTLIFLGVTIFLIAFFAYVRYYLYFQLITFKMTFKQIWKNSLMFAILGIKENMVITGSLVLMYAVGFLIAYAFGLLSVPFFLVMYVFLFPAFRSFLIQFTIFPLMKRVIIDPYYKEHPEEDLDKRHDLNLEDPQEAEGGELQAPQEPKDDKEDEVIFRDVVAEPESEIEIPKQYSQAELRKGGRRLTRDSVADDDDGTI